MSEIDGAKPTPQESQKEEEKKDGEEETENKGTAIEVNEAEETLGLNSEEIGKYKDPTTT